MQADDMTCVQEKPIPLVSFALLNPCGEVGSGKTYSTFKYIQYWQDFINSQKKDYDLDDFYNINYGDFTHIIYVSKQTSSSDQTIREQPKQVKDKLIFIQATEGTVENLCADLEKLKNNIKEKYGEIFPLIRNMCKMSTFYDDLKEHKRGNVYKQTLEWVESLKMDPDCSRLLLKEPDAQVRKCMKLIYEQCDMTYDGMVIRAPKIFLILDDCSNFKIFRSPKSNLREMGDKRRHYGIYQFIISTHRINDMWSYMRTNISQYMVWPGQTPETMKQIYDECGRIRSVYFTRDDFMSLYQNDVSHENKPNIEKTKEDMRDFIWIIKTPTPMVLLGFTKRVQ